MYNLTTKSFIAALDSASTAQAKVNEAATLAFAAQAQKAPENSVLHQAVLTIAAGKKKDIKNRRLDILRTMLSRWMKGQKGTNFEGKRVSIKTTGDISVALVRTTKGKKTATKTKKTGAKTTVKLMDVIEAQELSLDDVLKQLAEMYPVATIQASAAKLFHSLPSKK